MSNKYAQNNTFNAIRDYIDRTIPDKWIKVYENSNRIKRFLPHEIYHVVYEYEKNSIIRSLNIWLPAEPDINIIVIDKIKAAPWNVSPIFGKKLSIDDPTSLQQVDTVLMAY